MNEVCVKVSQDSLQHHKQAFDETFRKSLIFLFYLLPCSPLCSSEQHPPGTAALGDGRPSWRFQLRFLSGLVEGRAQPQVFDRGGEMRSFGLAHGQRAPSFGMEPTRQKLWVCAGSCHPPVGPLCSLGRAERSLRSNLKGGGANPPLKWELWP